MTSLFSKSNKNWSKNGVLSVTFRLLSVGMCAVVGMGVSENSLPESSFSFYHEGPEIKLGSSGLAAIATNH